MLFIALAFAGPPLAVGQPGTAPTDDAYTRHLKEYDERMKARDERVKELAEWEDQQRWKAYIPSLIFFGPLLIYLVYSQIAARRRYTTLIANARKDTDLSRAQNDQIIALLKSIDDRLGGGNG